GNTLECGACSGSDTCGGGGSENVCGCTPTTCSALGKNCGTAPDGCGGTLQCGDCDAPETCGGGGTPGLCGCTVQACENTWCGVVYDSCAKQTHVCPGACTTGQSCSQTTHLCVSCVVDVCTGSPGKC